MTILKRFRKQAATPPKTRAAPGLIGLDIGSNHIHLCQLRPRDEGGYSILAKLSIPFPGTREQLLAEPKKLKSLIQRGLKQKDFRGRRVAALMPWDEVRIILLTYKSSVKDVDDEVVKMLAGRVEGSLDDYVIDYVPVRSNPSDEEHMVMATVAARDKVGVLLDALLGCGLEVDSLDIAPTALRRVVSALYTGRAVDNVLLMHSYRDESYLTVVSGRRLLFSQTVAFSESLLLQRIAAELDIGTDAARALVLDHGLQKQPLALAVNADGNSDIPATLLEIVKPCFLELVNEINRVLVFTSAETHGVPVSRICLLGCLAQWPGAQQVLMSLLDFDPPEGQTRFAEIFHDENDATQMPWENLFSDISIAMGLALRGLLADD